MERFPLRLRRLLTRLGGDTRGVTLVEFGFVLGPLCLLLLGGLDLGYQSYLRSVVQGALDDVSRSGSMETPDFNCEGESMQAQIRCAIETRSNVVARNATYTISTRNFYDFSGVGRSEKLVTDYNDNGQYDEGDCWEDLNNDGFYDVVAGRDGVGGADDIVFYEVTVRMPRLVPMRGLFGTREEYSITARSAIRNQPYARQVAPPTTCG
ncbi:MAG: pilus assembly protein [Altererythrobacter sp.]|nr:pilus assembly protein [Altererythrobacter sp.]